MTGYATSFTEAFGVENSGIFVTFKNTATTAGDVATAELTFDFDIHLYSLAVGETMLHTNAASPGGLLTGNGAKSFHVFLLWANKDPLTYDAA